MAEGNFSACLAHVLRYEGGYVDHAKDPGGATNKGITHKTLAQWRGISPWSALSKQEVKSLSDDEISKIYRSLYWQRCRADEFPKGIDLAVFDFAVNSGPNRAVRYLQSVLRVPQDGYIGPVTLGALRFQQTQAQQEQVIRVICARRRGFLQRLKIFDVFGRGWMNRVRDVEKRALAMCQSSSEDNAFQQNKETKMDVLSGYKTYIAGGLMILSALAQLVGLDLPGLENQTSMQLLMEGFAIVFLRRGVQTNLNKG